MKSAVLGDRAIIKISGDDAEHFLENLVTCRITGLGENESVFGALLTPQGKIMYDFFVQRKKEGYLIDIARELSGEFAKRLTFYKLRAKVEISDPDVKTITVRWNCAAPEDDEFMSDPRHPDMGYRIYGSNEPGECNGDYLNQRVQIGIPEGGVDFEYGDAYPHETLMDQFGGVDFKKGCYVGQEVVSRMQHRGTAKKRIVMVFGDGLLPETGTPITADGKPAGFLGSVSGNAGLALLRLDRAFEAKSLLAGDMSLSIKIPDWTSFAIPGEAQ